MRLPVVTYILLFTTLVFGPPLHAQFIKPGDTDTEEEIEINITDADEAAEEEQSPESVRGIKAVYLENMKAVRISWSQAPADSELIIARDRKPITDLESLLQADSIGVVRSRVRYYTDYSVSRGRYYYAVVEKSKVREKTLQLKVGQNYTGSPVIAGRNEFNTNAPPQVSLIYAKQINEGRVRISWQGVSTPDIYYVIYRSTQPLSTPEAVSKSTRLDVIGSGVEYYIDKSLPGPGIYYYGVSTRAANGAEDIDLTPDQSYTTDGLRYNIVEIPIARFIRAEASEKGVTVSFKLPAATEEGEYTYALYRYEKPITSDLEREAATLVTTFKKKTDSYLEQVVRPGQWYYALVTVDEQGRHSREYKLGRNTLEKPVTVKKETVINDTEKVEDNTEKPVSKQVFSNLTVLQQNNENLISWDLNIPKARSVQVYRFLDKPADIKDIVNGKRIAKLRPQHEMYQDVVGAKGVHYYAVFGETAQGLEPSGFIRGVNLIGPVVTGGYNKPEQDETEKEAEKPEKEKPGKDENKELNKIIRKTYMRARYASAIEHLSSYIESEDKKVKAKALFYTGLSYYRNRDYRKALDFFVHPLVMRAYDERATEWYRKTLKRIR